MGEVRRQKAAKDLDDRTKRTQSPRPLSDSQGAERKDKLSRDDNINSRINLNPMGGMW